MDFHKGDHVGIIGTLYDNSFDKLITPRIIRWLYTFFVWVVTILAGVWTLISIKDTKGLSLVLGPLVLILYITFFRILVESVIIRFHMAQDIRDMRKHQLGN